MDRHKNVSFGAWNGKIALVVDLQHEKAFKQHKNKGRDIEVQVQTGH